MRFPPPARYLAPLLALVFGLVVTWFDYALNLSNDLKRHLSDVEEHANATGARLSKLSAQLLPRGETSLLENDLIASADYIIDLGPEGGDRGGKIISQGTPREIISNTESITAQFLKKELENNFVSGNFRLKQAFN